MSAELALGRLASAGNEHQDQARYTIPYCTCGWAPIPNLLMVFVVVARGKQLWLDSYARLS